MKKFLVVMLSVCLVIGLCSAVFAEDKKDADKVSGGLAKLADYLPKEVIESLAENFKEIEASDIEKAAGLVVSLENKNDPLNPDLDIYLLKNVYPDLASFAIADACEYCSFPIKVDLGDGKPECYCYFAVEIYYGKPFCTCNFITDVGDSNVIEFIYFTKAEKVEIASSGKTMLIPAGAKIVKSNHENAVCCYDYSDNNLPSLLKKITIYERDCKDRDDFEKGVLADCVKYKALGLSLVPFNQELACKVYYPVADNKDLYSEELAFYMDGKAYSVEFECAISDSDIVHPIINSIA